MLFEQAAEAKNRRFVGRGCAAKVNTGKAPQHGRFIERVLSTGIGEREPLLQKINSQHDGEANRLAAIACLGIVRLNQSF